jgi:hypothetical protein
VLRTTALYIFFDFPTNNFYKFSGGKISLLHIAFLLAFGSTFGPLYENLAIASLSITGVENF